MKSLLIHPKIKETALPLAYARVLKKRKNGSALLIVLAFLLLLVGLVLFFLGRTLVGRLVSDSSANQTKTQILAQNALDLIVGDLKQEIVDISTPKTVGNMTIYEPKYDATNPAATVMMPIINAPPAIPNLIRSSTRSDPAALTALGLTTRASASSSTDVSANGRIVDITRWNSHYLIPLKNSGSQDSTPIDAFQTYVPDWVIVTRGGPQRFTGWSNSLKDGTSGNANFATGRYAYSIYDEGGLIDANVAGFPSSLTASQVGEKGSVVFSDLTQLPNPTSTTTLSAAQVNQMVGWRNYATAQPSGNLAAGYTFNATAASNYFNYVVPTAGSPPAFLTTHTILGGGRTDQAFTSRQDLIRYQRATGLSADVLQYLGTFTRDLNQPCFSPQATPDATFSGTPMVTYPNGTTPVVQEVPVNNAASASNGHLLVQQRFALHHLALFSDPTATAANMLKYFGLTQVNKYTWTYTHQGSDNNIPTLAEIATMNRPPDFFEMLQAAILNGSLYHGSHIAGDFTTLAADPAMIIQLGANLINQYQPNNFPITIQINNPLSPGVPQLISGIDDLPYFSEMALWPYRPVTSDPYRSELDGYLVFELWNPHQNTSTVTGPSQLRLVIAPPQGAASAFINMYAQDGPPSYSYEGQFQSDYNLGASPTYQVVFNNSVTFREPTSLSSTEVIAAGTSPEWKTGVAGTSSGFLFGQYRNLGAIPDKGWADSQGLVSTGLYYYYRAMLYSIGSLGVQLQFLDPGTNNWYPYQGQPQVQETTSLDLTLTQADVVDALEIPSIPPQSNLAYTSATYSAVRSFQLVDPRYPQAITGQATPNGSARPDASSGMQASRYEALGPSGYVNPSGNPSGGASGVFPAMFNENVVGTNKDYLTDADGVTRPGDGALGSSPYLNGQTSGRPIILHRAFRSVGEMGYACRAVGDWKTLNFFSPTSADAGLLDYFSLEDAPVVAGKINLNTRQAMTLQAALSGAYREESSDSYLAGTDASNLAAAIVNHTATAPLMSRADLVRNLLAHADVTSVIDSIEGTTNKTIKGRREAMVRALADVGTTRTWNLLIDIVAQSGRYAPNTSQLSQFTVQGEKHYWFHVAIDRYTGQIIDQQLEDVNE